MKKSFTRRPLEAFSEKLFGGQNRLIFTQLRREAGVKRATTIKENYEFRRIYAKGKSGVSSCLVVYCRPNRHGHNRLGVTVSAKLGHAVVRNRIRRRLREIYRLSQPKMRKGFDIVLVARSRAVTADYWELERALLRTCEKLSLLERPE